MIYLEQQLQQYLPLNDRRFADLVSLAFGQSPDFATKARSKYQLTQSNHSEQQKMQRFLFGPNREITDTLNNLIQADIANIKEKVDSLARGDNNINAVSNSEVSQQILALGSTMQLLGLDDASQALKQAGNEVAAWQVPNSDDFDRLLNELMVAENAAIFLAKSHTLVRSNCPYTTTTFPYTNWIPPTKHSSKKAESTSQRLPLPLRLILPTPKSRSCTYTTLPKF